MRRTSPLPLLDWTSSTVELNFGSDDETRTMWRTKANLDKAFLAHHVSHAYGNGKAYFLQLEDDVVAANGFVSKILDFAHKQEVDKH